MLGAAFTLHLRRFALCIKRCVSSAVYQALRRFALCIKRMYR
jgi:hypothetical protein